MLTPCTSCRRYIKDDETACPFCHSAGRRLARGAAAVMAVAALTACQSNQPEPVDANDVTAPTADAPEAQPPQADPPAPEADNTPTPPPDETEPPAPTPAPTTSVADNKPAPVPLTPAPIPTDQRPMVARYGISPRLSPPPTKK